MRRKAAKVAEKSQSRSAFQNFFERVQGNFLRLGGQEEINTAAGVADGSDLADAGPSFTEFGENRDEHGEVVVDFALGDGHVQLHLAAIGGSELVFEVVARDLRAVDPLVEEPVEAAVSGEIH